MTLQQATNESPTARRAGRSTRNAWLYWILANGLGHVAGISAFGIVSLFINWAGTGNDAASVLDLAVPFALLGLFDGLMVGLAQGLVLRHFTGRGLLLEWALFTMLGGIAAWVLGPIVGGLTIPIIGVLFYVIAGGVAGLILGYGQRPTLMRNVDPEAAWLVPNMLAGAVGVTVAVAFSTLWASTGNAGGIAGGVEAIIVSVGLGGLAYGAMTARSLSRMLDYYAARSAYGTDEPTDDMTKLPVR